MDDTKQKASGHKKELHECKKQSEEFKSKYLRALADYQNFEKRVAQENEIKRERITAQICLKLLPFLDNLEKAQSFVKNPDLNLIKKGFQGIMKELGIQEMDVLDKPFDPYTSEAIEIVKGKENDKVIEVVRKGYLYKDSVLRVAQVKVSKNG